jgi:hypothetical protein
LEVAPATSPSVEAFLEVAGATSPSVEAFLGLEEGLTEALATFGVVASVEDADSSQLALRPNTDLESAQLSLDNPRLCTASLKLFSPGTISALSTRLGVEIADDGKEQVQCMLATFVKVLWTEVVKTLVTNLAPAGEQVITLDHVLRAVEDSNISLSALPTQREIDRTGAVLQPPVIDDSGALAPQPAFPNPALISEEDANVFGAVHTVRRALYAREGDYAANAFQCAFTDIQLLGLADNVEISIVLLGMLVDLHTVYHRHNPTPAPAPKFDTDGLVMLSALSIMLLSDIFREVATLRQPLDVDLMRAHVNPIFISRLGLTRPKPYGGLGEGENPLSWNIYLHAASPWVVAGSDIWTVQSKLAFTHSFWDVQEFNRATARDTSAVAPFLLQPGQAALWGHGCTALQAYDLIESAEVARNIISDSPSTLLPISMAQATQLCKNLIDESAISTYGYNRGAMPFNAKSTQPIHALAGSFATIDRFLNKPLAITSGAGEDAAAPEPLKRNLSTDLAQQGVRAAASLVDRVSCVYTVHPEAVPGHPKQGALGNIFDDVDDVDVFQPTLLPPPEPKVKAKGGKRLANSDDDDDDDFETPTPPPKPVTKARAKKSNRLANSEPVYDSDGYRIDEPPSPPPFRKSKKRAPARKGKQRGMRNFAYDPDCAWRP